MLLKIKGMNAIVRTPTVCICPVVYKDGLVILRQSAGIGNQRLVRSPKAAKSSEGQNLLSWHLPFYSEKTGYILIHSFKKGL